LSAPSVAGCTPCRRSKWSSIASVFSRSALALAAAPAVLRALGCKNYGDGERINMGRGVEPARVDRGAGDLRPGEAGAFG